MSPQKKYISYAYFNTVCPVDMWIQMKEAWFNFLCILKLVFTQNDRKEPKLSYFEAVLKQNMDSRAKGQSFLGNIED